MRLATQDGPWLVPNGDNIMNLLGNLPVNWFDLFVVIILIVGVFRGRKLGMSQELLPLLKWIVVILAAGFFHRMLAAELGPLISVGALSALIISYVAIALLVVGVFAFISGRLGGKIIGSDVFGGAEYYLGIISGFFRFTCILLFGLALLNARRYTNEEVADWDKFQQQNFDADFFPTLHSIQVDVFQKSFIGPLVRQNLSDLLIPPTIMEAKPLPRKELDLQGMR